MSDEKTKRGETRIDLPNQLKLAIDDETALGFYSNFQVVGSNETEFVVDFAYVPPNSKVGKVRARTILSPKHAKSLARLLQQRVADYESRFGAISVPSGVLVQGGGGPLPN